MSEKTSALHSNYIIDGVQQELTPAQLLDTVTVGAMTRSEDLRESASIADETLDSLVKTLDYDSGDIHQYLDFMRETERQLPLAYPATYTRMRMASALIDALWLKGHFKLEDLCLVLSWDWNEEPVGAMAAFYESARSAADYADAMGVWLDSYSYSSNQQKSEFGVKLECPDLIDSPAISDKLYDDPSSWLIYVPFDSAQYRLGASLLAQSIGLAGAAPECEDVRTFVDCYEVLREFVEDGILLSATTVGEGGLMLAASKMLSSEMDLELDISDIMRSYQEKSAVRVLFSEVPGVLIQIRDSDFDYVDAELLLQDVMYFPLAHPRRGTGEIRLKLSQKSAIQTILDSLMQNAEGED